MTTGADAFNQLDELARKLMADHDADLLLYSGPIETTAASRLTHLCRTRVGRRKNVFLFIMTNGGSADAAYRIVRCLRRSYETFTIYVSDYCKSAGTLVAVGANDLV
jgi:ClpP class serine protease